jgi:hypothetical protein
MADTNLDDVGLPPELLEASVARMSEATSGSSDFSYSRISLRSCGLLATCALSAIC